MYSLQDIRPPGRKLGQDFFQSPDVLSLAPLLLGKLLVSQVDNVRTSGLITELEAYRAPDDQASHARNNRRTERTEVMFHKGGRGYIYLCYGIHHLFNIVTGPEDMAHAVLIRAIQPLEGADLMLKRRYPNKLPDKTPLAMTVGPGALARALGLDTSLNGFTFDDQRSPYWIEEFGDLEQPEVASGKRIGVDYAGEWAEKPWRFWIKGTEYVKHPTVRKS